MEQFITSAYSYKILIHTAITMFHRLGIWRERQNSTARVDMFTTSGSLRHSAATHQRAPQPRYWNILPSFV